MQTEIARQQMIFHQIRPWDVSDARVLSTLTSVQRERFVPNNFQALAFADTALPLPCGQSMLKPIVEGRLLQHLDLRPDDKVLVIGTGSGYLTACIANLAAAVISLDIHAELTDAAATRLADEQIRNVELQTTNFQDYRPTHAFDRIVVTGSMPTLDSQLIDWLKPGGKLVAIVGEEPAMSIELIVRNDPHYTRTKLVETVVPSLENIATSAEFSF
jgi:protein-L-isoaspartate(D-aspartate) O-methyltransferase